jgi:ATP phosphoribosyltransferase
MNSAALVIAIPSKGRIEEETHGVFARAGLPIAKRGGVRGYSGTLQGLADAEVRFLSSGEIPAALESGDVHLGVTGHDLILDRTAQPERSIALVKPLGFGRADVVVAVPRAWIDVGSMADLAEAAALFRHRHHRHMRVATKYARLARKHFADHGLVDYRLVESAGATEAAPSNGQAELIVDITTTGATLKANGLKIPEDGLILASEAYLVASLRASWSPRARTALRGVLDAIVASEEQADKPGTRRKAPARNTLAQKLLAQIR